MGNISLIIYHGRRGWDVSGMVSEVVWSGRKGSAARAVEVTMMDGGKGQPHVNIDVEKGYTCVFGWKEKEKFRGIIMRVSRTQGNTVKWKAYDECIYLANSKDSFSYENKTASYIFEDCVRRAGLTPGQISDTAHVIPSLKKPKAYFYDCMLDALGTTFGSTGKRYYIRADKGKISLLMRQEHMTQWVVEIGANILGYAYSKSIEKIKTRFRIYSEEGRVVYEQANEALEKSLGRFVMVDSVKEKHTDEQIISLVNSMVEENGHPEESLTVETLGIISAISGGCLYVVIPHLGLKRTFYIDEDRHTFKGESHLMSLKLNFAPDAASAG